MSEPVTNAEIEDVLSSIRRLVSEDARNTVRQPVAEPEQVPDRLVLTPSLRVADEETEDDHEEAAEPVSEAAEIPEEPAAELLLQTEIEPDGETGDAAMSDAPWGDPEATLYDAAGYEAGTDENAEPDEPEMWSADESEEDELRTEDVWSEPEAAEDDVQADGEDDMRADVAEDDWHAPDEGAAEEEAEADLEEEPGLATAVEALGAAMDGAEAEQWEPHGDETADDLAVPETEPMEWHDEEDAAQDVQTAEPVIEYLDEDADDDADLFDDDEAVLDEATLRELVTDIVREELQGALGERITRNVRKLVRREINRALSVQDLD